MIHQIKLKQLGVNAVLQFFKIEQARRDREMKISFI